MYVEKADIWDSTQRRKEKRERKREREGERRKKNIEETKIYVYIEDICLSDSGSPSAKGNKTDLCVASPFICVLKRFYSGK